MPPTMGIGHSAQPLDLDEEKTVVLALKVETYYPTCVLPY
jgi:hypothetical protein